ncbi:MerR family transcriptional regulator [Chitinophaga silvatica]|uniref:MerR family transcriptional regulator n=1 Tax=Chitinophaga silvatica TaxID=2282649 RepID=A0A3E1YET2_9BACT|nr:MerR family transcriptional regulator [Chitinophaga silvatica]RFS25004.1 MerR family transcriptional regulator [Chitinophaga silvatica]
MIKFELFTIPDLNTFTIKDIEGFTGIKAHTIRIWEQRYNLFKARRKDTNHRIYDGEDLKVLLRIAYLYHNGIKISKIASMSETRQNELTIEISQSSQTLYHIHELIDATVDYDQERFEKVFLQQITESGIEQTITTVVYPFLEKIGILWLTNNVIPAQEHFASNIIKTKLVSAIDALSMNYQCPEHFLLFLPEGEFHEIPLLYVHYLLKKNGKMVTYFGPNIPLEDLGNFINTKKITHLYTHILTQSLPFDLSELTLNLSERYPRLQILISGPQANLLQAPLPANIIRLEQLNQLTNYF